MPRIDPRFPTLDIYVKDTINFWIAQLEFMSMKPDLAKYEWNSGKPVLVTMLKIKTELLFAFINCVTRKRLH
jgi:hypothetical protein